MKLDTKPDSWEDQVLLFAAALVEDGYQSSMLRSYLLAIKTTLVDDNYDWDDNKILTNTLTRACWMLNDKVMIRLLIHKNLLELIIFELQRLMDSQPFLLIMYKTFFLLAYYGLFRVGELAKGTHSLKAANVHIAQNKDKLLFILYSSKTHNVSNRPQKIKISTVPNCKQRFFCPFKSSREYLAIRGQYLCEDEQFFIHHDMSPVTPYQVQTVLHKILKSINFNPKHYNVHSFRAGHCCDLLKSGVPIEEIHLMGRWRSNAIYCYIRM